MYSNRLFCHFIVSIKLQKLHKITKVIDLKQLKMDYNASTSYIGKKSFIISFNQYNNS